LVFWWLTLGEKEGLRFREISLFLGFSQVGELGFGLGLGAMGFEDFKRFGPDLLGDGFRRFMSRMDLPIFLGSVLRKA